MKLTKEQILVAISFVLLLSFSVFFSTKGYAPGFRFYINLLLMASLIYETPKKGKAHHYSSLLSILIISFGPAVALLFVLHALFVGQLNINGLFSESLAGMGVVASLLWVSPLLYLFFLLQKRGVLSEEKPS